MRLMHPGEPVRDRELPDACPDDARAGGETAVIPARVFWLMAVGDEFLASGNPAVPIAFTS
ncbi:MAG: hypothetical protein ACYTGL_12480 [Planctomycetota bacterium]